MALNPTLNSGIAPESPVQQPSALEGVAGLANLFVGSMSRKGQVSESDKKRAIESSLNQALVSGLEKAQELRRQGKLNEATRMERVVKVNFAKEGGDLGSADTKALISTYTGRDAEDVGFSDEEIVYKETLESPEFKEAYLSTYQTNPDATEEERLDLSFSRIQKKQATEAIIDQTKYDWNANQGQSSRISLIDDWWTSRMGVLSLSGKEGGRVDQNTVQASLLEFGQLEARIRSSRPANISNEEWKPIEDYLDTTRKQLEIAERLTSNEEMASDQLRTLLDGVKALPPELASNAEKNLVILTLMDNRQNFVESGLLDRGRWLDILSAAGTIKVEDNPSALEAGVGTSNDQASDSFTTSELESVKGDPAKQFKDAKSLSDAMGGVANVVEDPKALSSWIGFTRQGLANLYSMAAENEAWATAEGYRSFFTDNFFNTMGELKRTNSEYTYSAIRGKAIETIDVNQRALRSNIQSRLGDGPIRYNRATNSLQMDWGSLSTAGSTITSEQASSLRTAMDQFYGGDLKAALKDKGKRFKDARASFGNQDDPQANLGSFAFSVWRKVISPYEDDDITKRLDAIDQLESFRTRLPSVEGETGRGGISRVEGGEGVDRLDASAAPLLGLINKYEGAGDYDTLFDHSQREGKDFAGTKVSQMTLGQLSDFSQGAYADWSKGRLGYVATPMGKYQIVGDTLRQTMKEMGLPRNILFTPAVQDAMFHHLATKALRGKKTAAAKREAMRKEWVGFKRVSDEELDNTIASFEGSPAPTLKTIQSDGSNVQAAPTEATLRPQPNPFTMGESNTSTGGTSLGGGLGGSVSPSESLEAPEVGETTREVKEGIPRASEQEIERLSDNTKAMLKKLGVDTGSLPSFDSQEELNDAIEKGLIKDGDVVLVEGRTQIA